MPKKREPLSFEQNLSQISSFGSQADEVSTPIQTEDKQKYKSLTVSFTKLEYEALQKACDKTGRGKLNFIRWAIKQALLEN